MQTSFVFELCPRWGVARLSVRAALAALLFIWLLPCTLVGHGYKIKILPVGQVTSEHCPAPDWFSCSNKLQDQKSRIDRMMDEARESYLQGLYEDALDQAHAVHDAVGDLELRCMKLKDQALLWVYMTEWAAVSGTGMIAGYILFLLLLRRRLYREVSLTRASH